MTDYAALRWQNDATRKPMPEPAPHRTHLMFDLRTTLSRPLAEVAEVVARTLSCEFQEEDVEKVSSLVANVMGLEIVLQPWSVHDRRIVRLRGQISGPLLAQRVDGHAPSVTRIDISPYLLDLLTLSTDLDWYLPNRDDELAESETARQLYDAF